VTATELPPVDEVVPHQGRVLLLDCVLEHDKEATTVSIDVGRQTWLTRDDGSVASWVALEFMAQCVAAHEGVCALLEGRPPIRGSLAAASGLRLYRSSFEAGSMLHVHTRRIRGRPGLGAISHFCTIREAKEFGEGPLLAEGRLSFSIPKANPSAG
jgi:predicted hotdog family 3-hydroxylacyl-ACP dehydratase